MQTNSGSTVFDIWSHIEPKYGGIGPSAACLAQAVTWSSGWHSKLLAVCHPTETQRHDYIPSEVKKVTIAGFRPLIDLSLGGLLKDSISSCNVCHIHGIWEPHSIMARKLAQDFKVPIVSSVHGMLSPWELAKKRVKKHVYSAIWERPSLKRSSCLRALSMYEAANLRAFGLNNPIAVIPNGIARLTRVDTSAFLERFPALKNKKVVLFLGRIHYQKGVLNLLRAWPMVVRKHSEAHLLLAGPEDHASALAAREIIHEEKLEHSVTLSGALHSDAKLSAFSLAQTFCLPSFSEGMSVAILEALSIGLPVVITRACNGVDGLENSGAGYVTECNEPTELAASLTASLSLSSSSWRAMSEAAGTFAQRFDWQIIGRSMLSVYEWLLGGRKPSCVLD